MYCYEKYVSKKRHVAMELRSLMLNAKRKTKNRAWSGLQGSALGQRVVDSGLAAYTERRKSSRIHPQRSHI
jgi:hypothetical protein